MQVVVCVCYIHLDYIYNIRNTINMYMGTRGALLRVPIHIILCGGGYSCRTPGVVTARVYSFPTCFSYYYHYHYINFKYIYNMYIIFTVHHPGGIVPTSLVALVVARARSSNISHTHNTMFTLFT